MITAGLILGVLVLFYLVYRHGKKYQKSREAEEALERAKIAKNVRSGAKLGDEWMQYRD